MILDTPMGVWWVHGDAPLPDHDRTSVEVHETQGLGVSVIACWEVAKVVEYSRLPLPGPVAEWLDQARAYPGIRLLALTPQMLVESTQLPGTLHRDPADQLLVATARVYHCPFVTVDTKILAYPHVHTAP